MIPRSRIPCGTNHAGYLVNTVVPYFAQRRYDLLAGLVDNQRMRDTSAINSTKQRLLQNQGPARLDWVHQKFGMYDNATHYFCLGDLSCTCGEAAPGWACIHLEAAAEHFGQDVNATMVNACADDIKKDKLMQMGRTRHTCKTLACAARHFASVCAEGDSGTYTEDHEDVPWCTCTVFHLGGRDWCPHLTALCETPVDPERVIPKEDIRAFRRTRDLTQLNEEGVKSQWQVQVRNRWRFFAQDAINKIIRLAPLADDSEKARREITEAFSQCVSVLETHSTELKRTRTAEDDENDARNARRGSMRSFKARYHYPLKIS